MGRCSVLMDRKIDNTIGQYIVYIYVYVYSPQGNLSEALINQKQFTLRTFEQFDGVHIVQSARSAAIMHVG